MEKQRREKYREVKMDLQSVAERARGVAILQNVPIDAERPLEMIIRERVAARGLPQNAYMWIRIGEISDQAYCDGRKFNTDTWHEYLKENVMPEIITLKDGTIRSKWIEKPFGGTTVISTTELEKSCFANYCTMIEAFGASLGVRFSANPRDYQENR